LQQNFGIKKYNFKIKKMIFKILSWLKSCISWPTKDSLLKASTIQWDCERHESLRRRSGAPAQRVHLQI
jgi:hypothetical protein